MNQQLFEKGLKEFQQARRGRSQVRNRAPERRRRLPEPAESRRSQGRARRRSQAGPEESERVVQPRPAGEKHRRRAGRDRCFQARHRDRSQRRRHLVFPRHSLRAGQAVSAGHRCLRARAENQSSARLGRIRSLPRLPAILRHRPRPRAPEALPVHHAKQNRRAHEPGLRRAGPVLARGGIAASATEAATADQGAVCGCDEGSWLVFNPAPASPNSYKGFPNYLGAGACFLDYDNDGNLTF